MMNEFNLVICFESLPPSDLYPNKLRTLHWSKRAKVEAEERKLAYYIAKSSDITNWVAPDKAILSFEFYSSTKRIFDLDNAISACKAWIDGLKDSGIILSDDCWHLSYGYAKVIHSKEDETRLILKEDK